MNVKPPRATLWKSMKSGLRSDSGDIGPWKVGEWRIHPGKLEICRSGFHASENVIHSMRYVWAEVIAKVEVRGEHLEQDDKQVWSEMRIAQAWTWTAEDSVSLAVYAVELGIGEYEKCHPNYAGVTAWAAASKDIVDKCHAFVLARLATKGIPVEEEENWHERAAL